MLKHFTADQFNRLLVLAEAVESDWVRLAEQGKYMNLEASVALLRDPASCRLQQHLRSLGRQQVEELIAIHMHHNEVRPTLAECRERAAQASIEYLLCEPLIELFAVLAEQAAPVE